MALNERCPNAWHMLIERLVLSFFFNLTSSGVQVSKWYYNHLRVRRKIPYINKETNTLISGFALRSLYLG